VGSPATSIASLTARRGPSPGSSVLMIQVVIQG
jgi:hypothetical protein